MNSRLRNDILFDHLTRYAALVGNAQTIAGLIAGVRQVLIDLSGCEHIDYVDQAAFFDSHQMHH